MIEWLTKEQIFERYPVPNAFDSAGFQKEIGVRMRLARKRKGITQEAIAERIGIPRATYANVESGRQRVPTDVVWRAAVALRVPVQALIPEPL